MLVPICDIQHAIYIVRRPQSMFGIHISKQFDLGTFRTLENAVDKIVTKYDLNACQVFLYGPQSRNKNNYNIEEMKMLSEKTRIYVHSTYLTDGYWSAVEDATVGAKKLAPTADAKLRGYFKHIQDQLDATNEINGKGLVIHITRKPMDILISGMALMEQHIKQGKAKVILEFRAMKSSKDCSYERSGQVNKLCSGLASNKLDWGLCIDTAHMWATGVKMQELPTVKKWFKELKYPHRINLFHLNAAENSTFAVGRDIHIVPLAHNDDIWGNLTSAKSYEELSNKDYAAIRASSMGYILLWAKKNKVPIIGEFKRGTISEFELAIDVCQVIIQ